MKKEQTAAWLNRVRDRTAFNARHERIGGRYVIEARTFAGWTTLGQGRTVQEAYAEARQHDTWDRCWRDGNPIRAVAENVLGLWVLGTDGVWFREISERGAA